MIKRPTLLLLVFTLSFQSCVFEGHRKKATNMLRYTGSKYTFLRKPVFYRGERIFFEVPVLDFILSDGYGNFLFKYNIKIKDTNGKIIYNLDSEKQYLRKEDTNIKNSSYLKFFYDSKRRQKKGTYTFIVKLIDLNWQNEKVYKKTFVLK